MLSYTYRRKGVNQVEFKKHMFNEYIVLGAIESLRKGEDITPLYQKNIEHALSFLDSIYQFTNGKAVTYLGVSGLEAFSFYVMSGCKQGDGSIPSLGKIIKQLHDDMQVLVSNATSLSEESFQAILDTFEKIKNHAERESMNRMPRF